jgi:hypothetical protein
MEDTQEVETTEVSYEMSYNELIDSVRRAWEETNDYMGWVCDVYASYVILHMRKEYFRVPYSRTDDKISFAPNNEWTKVEKVSEWVSKSVNPYAIKALGDERFGGYGVLFGDETNKDLHGEYFTKNTEELTIMLDQLGGLPFMYHHAADGTLKSTVIGIVDKMETDDTGTWFEAKVKDHEAYRKYVKPLIERQMLFPSSGTLPAAKRVKKNGEITRWPIIEMTGTPTPAEYRMLNVPIDEVKSYYKSIGLEFDYNDETDEVSYEDTRKALGIEKVRHEANVRQAILNLKLMSLRLG